MLKKYIKGSNKKYIFSMIKNKSTNVENRDTKEKWSVYTLLRAMQIQVEEWLHEQM